MLHKVALILFGLQDGQVYKIGYENWSSGVCVDKPKDRICKIASGMMGMINIVR